MVDRLGSMLASGLGFVAFMSVPAVLVKRAVPFTKSVGFAIVL